MLGGPEAGPEGPPLRDADTSLRPGGAERARPGRPAALLERAAMTDRTGEARRRCVLLGDPEPQRRHATALLLKLGGYRVVEVGAMSEIPEAAREGIDIFVSEAQLEDGSALAYAAYLRRDPRTVSLPILIATYDREAAASAADALGEDGALELPAPPSALLDRVGELLARAVR